MRAEIETGRSEGPLGSFILLAGAILKSLIRNIIFEVFEVVSVQVLAFRTLTEFEPEGKGTIFLLNVGIHPLCMLYFDLVR
jgi:hypothetical protein